MAGIKINQYPLERLAFGDDDYYDIDYWNGSAFETAKIKGSVIKTAIQAGIASENIMDTNSLVLAGNFTHDLNSNNLVFDDGSLRVTNGDLGVLGGFNAQHDGVGALPIASFISSGGNPVLIIDNTKEALGIGTGSPQVDSILDITSTSKAVLLPRLTTTQRNNIGSPAESMLIYNTTTDQFEFYSASGTWDALGAGGDSIYTVSGTVPSSIIATLTDTLRFKDGTVEIQGSDTLSTSSALAIYDGDGTPNKIWDFTNDGSVKIGQDSIFNLNTNKLEFKNSANTNSLLILDDNAQATISNTISGLFLQYAGSSTTGKLSVISDSVITNSRHFEVKNQAGSHTSLDIDTISTSGKISINNSVGTQMEWSNDKVGITGSSTKIIRNNVIRAYFADTFTIFGTDNTTTISGEDISLQGTVLINDTLDMYNNRILNAVVNPSVQEATNSATFTINADQETDGVLTAMSANTTIASPTGTPVQSQDLVFRFKDDGTARTLTWNAIFRAIGVTLPTTTVANKLTYVGCKYNSTDSKWDVIAVQQEA